MKIYTKTGDKGKTSLIGGKRVYKYNKQVESYGTIDELISYIGLIRSNYQTSTGGIKKYKFIEINKNTNRCVGSCIIYLNKVLLKIQERLMVCASIIAKSDDSYIELPILDIDNDLLFLEKEIDKMDVVLPELESFILPGGNVISAHCNIARTICRRSERMVIELSHEPYDIDYIKDVIKYLNRLSDYLFTLGRFLNNEETLWFPKK